ncbi:MAG: efflux RND transporter periplasmic adaptor subunit [Sulfitobacter sp.]
MRFLRQSMIGLFLAAVATGLLLWAAQMVGSAVQARLNDDRRAPPSRERVFAVNVLLAEPGNHTPVIETFGEVQSRRRLELRPAEAGRVIEIANGFEDGGEVTAGQLLVQLDRQDAQAAVARAQNDLADAQAEVRDAARALELARDEHVAAEEQSALRIKALARQNDLAARGVGTAAATEEAELAAAAARAAVLVKRQSIAQGEARRDQAATQLARAGIALAEMQRLLADTTLTAPFSGRVSEVNVVEGRLVSANERLAELIDPDDLEVSFRVSTAQYTRLLDGNGGLLKLPVTAHLDISGLDLAATGRVTRASAGAGEGATGRLIFARLDRNAGFRPGDFVTVKVQEPELRGAVKLPASAVDAAQQVLVLGAADRLEAVPIELLRRQGDDVLVRGPIAGREVVEARSPLLGAGIAVKPLRGTRETPKPPEMLELTEERRARLVAFVEANNRMPEAAKARVLAQLAEPQVPAQMVARIESRMGG